MERVVIDILDEVAEPNRAYVATFGARQAQCAVLANGVVLLPLAFTELVTPHAPTSLEKLRQRWR